MELVEKLAGKYEVLKRKRQNWENLWQNVSKYTLPVKGNFTSKLDKGTEVNDKIFDNTPTIACEMLAAGLHGMLTNPSIDWFAFKSDMEDSQDNNKWLEYIKDAVSEEVNRPSAAFSTNIHEVYLDLVVFGTACLYLTWNEKENTLQFQAIPLEQIYIDEDYVGNIDTVFRSFRWPLNKIIEVFGEDSLPPELLSHKYEKEEEFEIVHSVFKEDKKAVSIYWMPEKRHIIKESSYFEMPYMIARWSKSSSEVYGRSPAINCLSDIRMLQELMKETIIAVQLANRPPLLVPNDDTHNPIDIYPNALIRYRNGTPPQPLNLATRPDIAFNFMQDLRDRIRAAFYTDQLAFGTTPNRTATEVIEQVNTRNRLLLPILARLTTDLLEPLIERAYNLLERHGMLPEPPQNTQEVKVEYIGSLAISQKTSQNDRYLSMLQYVTPFLQMDPTAVSLLDIEASLRDIANSYNLGFVVKDSTQVEEEQAQASQMNAEQVSLQNEMTAADIQNKRLQNATLEKNLTL